MSTPDKALLRPDEVAGVLKVSVRSVYYLIERGQLAGMKFGTTKALRVRREDLDRFLASCWITRPDEVSHGEA
jgi:excisionase family DNA binding protein